MANKRIQKKRAKAAWERDKRKIIAECLVAWYPSCTHYEYLRMATPLLRMDKGPLLELLMRENLRRSPFRRMIPRKTFDASTLVNWRPVISDVRER